VKPTWVAGGVACLAAVLAVAGKAVLCGGQAFAAGDDGAASVAGKRAPVVAPEAGARVLGRIAEPGELLSSALRAPARGAGSAVRSARPGGSVALAPPRVALLATQPGSSKTSLVFQAVDTAVPAPPVATFAHLPRTSVAGAVVPHTHSVLVIAGTRSRRDPAFGASLLLVGEQQETKLVLDGVYHATRPLLLDDGRAVVQRGAEGPEPTEADLEAGRMRVDRLTVEVVDLAGGGARVLSRFDGYVAFVAGALRHEVFVYRVGPEGADLIGVDADTGRERTIVRPLPPFARDFSIDAQNQALLFTDVDPDAPGEWVAQRVSVAPAPLGAPVVPPASSAPVVAKMERLLVASHPGLAPSAWVGGGVVANQDQAGLQMVRGTAAAPKVPFTAGVDVVRDFFSAQNETWALAVHREEGQLPQPVLIQASTLNVQKIAIPPQARVDVAGVLEPEGAPRPQIQQLTPSRSPAMRLDVGRLRSYTPPESRGDVGEEER
jgi:hypothetical protein